MTEQSNAQIVVVYGDEGREWFVSSVPRDIPDADVRAIVSECARGGTIKNLNTEECLVFGQPDEAWIADAVIHRDERMSEGHTILMRPKVAFG